ncbi:hypothetical protein NLI96_g11468 [Meripilus lineatus]|uniref:Cytochrome P450 n=1 Tax=Meripilus lineatus TaxID=2056292 RepID=A0AAD5URS6_9APHY|nr:hypothetical protein NLI96_g11468 [Physisporinus lineatus]
MLVSTARVLVLKAILKIAFLQLVVFFSTRVIASFFHLNLSTWLFVCLQVFSLPLFFAGHVIIRERRIAQEASRRDAIVPPTILGKYIGNLDVLMYFVRILEFGYLGDGVTEWFQQTRGNFCLQLLWDTQYATSDSNVIKAILSTQFSSFDKGELLRGSLYSVLGTGVLNSDGEMWSFHRSMTRPFFSRERISHFDLYEKHAEVAITKLKDRFRSGMAVDFQVTNFSQSLRQSVVFILINLLQDLISRFTLDVGTEFLFGSCIGSLGIDLPHPHHSPTPTATESVVNALSKKFTAAFCQAQEALIIRFRLGWCWPWFEVFHDRTADSMRIIDDHLEPILKNAIQKAESEKASGYEAESNEDGTLLDHLVKMTTGLFHNSSHLRDSENSITFALSADPVILHDQVLNILIAARDTTASALTFAVYFMCKYPDVLDRLRKEILDTVGSSKSPTLEDIREMRYLRAVIMRLYDSTLLYIIVRSPMNVRCSNQDTMLPNSTGKPFYIPAGTTIMYSVYHMHRRTDYWGPDAETFDPDRFLDERVTKYLVANPFIFLPFNAGPRICLGQQFAYNEVSFFLVRLLQNFSSMSLDLKSQPPETLPPSSWKNCPGRKGIEEVFPKSHLTIYSYGGLWVKMQESEVGL